MKLQLVLCEACLQRPAVHTLDVKGVTFDICAECVQLPPGGRIMSDLDPWMRDPDQLETFILAAVKHGDIQGADYGLRFLALADPARAERMIENLRTALHIVQGGEVTLRTTWEWVPASD